ncbi:MAG TPA: hypothetical protein VK835_04545 [Bacteroidia bacterium]|jgi:hypothetical protein|nr:hypothetical protein [Bacteroidia bacterium]
MTDDIETLIQDPNNKEEKKGIPLYVQLIISTLFILAFIHAARTRTVSEFIYPTVYFVGIISLVLAIIYYPRVIKTGIKNEPKLTVLITSIVILFVVPISGIAYYSAFVSIKDIFVWTLDSPLTKNHLIIWMPILVSVCAIGLFLFRLKFRAIYGLVEALTGIVVTINSDALYQNKPLTSITFYLAMLTAAYLIVRGLDNIDQGLNKEPLDPIGTKIYGFLKRRV